ncbi:MAG: sodium:proton exchanger [Candidatus Epulonipiscium fishelsonii]|nr:MAG: sodium:proton exchanger [Epulopiscium sp. AS2M-Bin002]
MEYILLLVGFILLIKGADFFVEGASSIAATLRVPSLIIGLTIVAFGTSAPELAVSVTSALSNSNAIAVGNVIGSNIFNILMVVGISALICPLKVEKSILLKEFPFTLMGTAVLLILGYDTLLNGTNSDLLSKSDGWILLIFFGIFLYYLVESALESRKNTKNEEDEIEKMPMSKSIIMSIGGIIGIVLGGDVVVDNATIIALSLGMTEGLVGLTIVAIGTSLPELVTSVVAAKKGESDIALGNVMGSNIFNMFLILGVSTIINPIPITAEVFTDIMFMGLTMLVAFIFAITKRTIGRAEGGIFVVSYIAYMSYIIMR